MKTSLSTQSLSSQSLPLKVNTDLVYFYWSQSRGHACLLHAEKRRNQILFRPITMTDYYSVIYTNSKTIRKNYPERIYSIKMTINPGPNRKCFTFKHCLVTKHFRVWIPCLTVFDKICKTTNSLINRCNTFCLDNDPGILCWPFSATTTFLVTKHCLITLDRQTFPVWTGLEG